MRNFGNFQDESCGLSAVGNSFRAQKKNRYSMVLLIRLSEMLAGPVRNLKLKNEFNIPPMSRCYAPNDHLREPPAGSFCGVGRYDFQGGRKHD
jgi:hypothetical protein